MSDDPRPVHTWLTDMDGVLVHEEEPIPGGPEFIEALKASGLRFLVLTNNSIFTPRDLRARLLGSGIDVPEEAIWTSALATANFLADQRPGGSAYVVGEAGLTTALHDIGYVMTDRDPDYVVLGETRTYSFEAITRAIRLIEGGARFIATNPDVSGPSPAGSLPATGSVAALISTATRRSPHFIRQPKPPMMRSALHPRQVEPADDALGPQPARGALGDHRDGRRPDGHRHHQRPRGGAPDRTRHHRLDPARGDRAVPLPPHPRRRLDRGPRRAGRAGRRERPGLLSPTGAGTASGARVGAAPPPRRSPSRPACGRSGRGRRGCPLRPYGCRSPSTRRRPRPATPRAARCW